MKYPDPYKKQPDQPVFLMEAVFLRVCFYSWLVSDISWVEPKISPTESDWVALGLTGFQSQTFQGAPRMATGRLGGYKNFSH